MEGQTMEARRTEYKGTVYRSKSEAMFAASLDFFGRKWIYEPSFYSVPFCGSEWIPDFAVAVHNRSNFCWDIVEFKPARVTPAYLGELSEKAIKLFAQQGPPIEFHLVAFNWFDPEKCDMVYDIDRNGFVSQVGNNYHFRFITPASYKYATNYRYDLAEDSSSEPLTIHEMGQASELQLLIESKRGQHRG